MFVAVTVWHGMLDHGAVIHVLRATRQVKPVQRPLATLSLESHPYIVTRQGGAKDKRRQRIPTVSTLVRVRCRHVIRAIALALYAVAIRPSTVCQRDFRHCIGPVGATWQACI